MMKRRLFLWVWLALTGVSRAADGIDPLLLQAAAGNRAALLQAEKKLERPDAFSSAEGLRVYSEAYALLKKPGYRKTVRKLREAVLSAPVKRRDDLLALIACYEFTGDTGALAAAVKAAEGGNPALGPAFPALYRVTADRRWLEKAVNALPDARKNPDAGYIRLANTLSFYTGKNEYRAEAEKALKAADASLKNSSEFPVAEWELSHPPLHIAVAGGKSDKNARALFEAALRYPSFHKRLEWWDKAEGPLPNKDVQYPELGKPAAFICSGNICSLPIFDPDGLAETAGRLSGLQKRP